MQLFSFGRPAPAFHQDLRSWYLQHGRHHLPWRQTSDSYAIWISEVMLQQTQVATVLARYYHPFLERFPTLESLAAASPDQVIKAWEGLGYYSRARNLHRAAQLSDGRLPQTVETLLALPGIGRNTAQAIAAFAYRHPVPVMEANVKRVIHRLLGRERMNEPELWQAADELLDRDDPFTHNQAMMDIGSLICTPRRPACPICPLNAVCLGKDTPERYPARREKIAVPVRHCDILIFRNLGHRYYLPQRQEKLLGGLHGFPQMQKNQWHWQEQPVIATHATKLGGVRWTYSHFKLESDVYLMERNEDGADWHGRNDIAALALSGVDKKALERLDAYLAETR